MSNKEIKLTVELRHDQVMSWIVGNNSDDGLLNDQFDWFKPVHKVTDDDTMINHAPIVHYESPIIHWSSPYVVKNDMGLDIFVADITIMPPD